MPAPAGSDAPPPPAASEREPAGASLEWAAAEDGDVAALVALARQEGALRLVEVAQRDPRRRKVALGALPRAEDAELSLGPLCRWLAAGSPDPSLLLRAVHDVVDALPRDRERLDVWGARGCVRVLGQLRTSNGLSVQDRELAFVTRTALAAWLGPEPEPGTR